MSAATKIEWADSTFNPVIGCTKVGPGCDNCYAEELMAHRMKVVRWGAGAARKRTSESNWKEVLRWNRQGFYECSVCGARGTIKQIGENPCPSEEFGPIHTPIPARRRVFCASLSDWLDNEWPIEWLVDLLDLIRRTPNLDWLLLSKRIGNWRKRIEEAYQWCEVRAVNADGAEFERAKALGLWLDRWLCGDPPANAWLGSTVVNQAEADRDVPKLLAVPAQVRFLSMEPLLGAITFWTRWTLEYSEPHLDWVIVGGESGPHARPMHPDWALDIARQCREAGVPHLFKQWGEWLPINQQTEQFFEQFYRSNRKALPHEDQEAIDESYGRRCTVQTAVVWHDGSIREITEPMASLQGKGAMTIKRVGKQAAGRLLDGLTWDEFPKGSA